MSGTKIKICGLMEPGDIETVNLYKPDYAGFIINFPKSHRSKTPDQVAELRHSLSSDITPVGVFVDQPAEEVIELLKQDIISVAQLHGYEDESYIRLVQEATGKPVFKAFVIRSADDLAKAFASPADEILLDAGLGGGTSFDWSMLERYSRSDGGTQTAYSDGVSDGAAFGHKSGRFILAGGLNSDNIKKAIATVHPWCVDISSGVETDKHKDPAKIAEIINLIRNESI